jgi:hypothetical protein
MSGPITISAEERDLLYHRIMIHLSGIDAVWLAARHEDFAAADRLGRQFSDELQLVLDDLGWGETRGDEPVQLSSPPDVVRRVIEHLRDLASAEDVDDRKSREATRLEEEEVREVQEVCVRLLGALDGTAVTQRGSSDA